MANPSNMSAKRVCLNKDAKLDSSFSDSAVPPHHFHLGQDIYAVPCRKPSLAALVARAVPQVLGRTGFTLALIPPRSKSHSKRLQTPATASLVQHNNIQKSRLFCSNHTTARNICAGKTAGKLPRTAVTAALLAFVPAGKSEKFI
ncbi:hypothetical protein NPIL_73401 [Nephila pilipes]|uniref:Uncharacterized protein n=1 Tax=Nephila pilipes TaxID=299642 RepID=A0A8X6QJ05_NEPPI|nr:hypothetical protein NPIL_73401 [Nephila pilipes]